MLTSLLSQRRLRLLGPVIMVVALGVATAQATTVEPMTFSQVVAGADVIAFGTVTAIHDTWDDELKLPFTQVTFTDLETLKGVVAGPELALRFLGGIAPDGLTLVVPGMPRFAVGDRAAVFSTGNGLRPCPLVGWWQGLYRLIFDAGQDAFTVADHAGRPVAAIDGTVGRMTARLAVASHDDAVPPALTLDAFRNAVQSAVR